MVDNRFSRMGHPNIVCLHLHKMQIMTARTTVMMQKGHPAM
jgi:hypothetical protein